MSVYDELRARLRLAKQAREEVSARFIQVSNQLSTLDDHIAYLRQKITNERLRNIWKDRL